nr:hypothetical protein [Tanacetum cinerariifolium]
KGTCTILGVPDVPIYTSKSDKEYWGDSDEEDDDDDFEDDVNNNDDDSDDNGGSEDHDDDSDDERMESNIDEIPNPKARHNFIVLKQVAQVMELTLSQSDEEDDDDDFEDDVNNNDNDSDDNGGSEDHDDDSDDERMESYIDEIPNPSKSNEEHDEEEEEYDDEFNVEEGEKMEEEEDDEVTKELYKDVNVNLRNKDADMTDASQEKKLKLKKDYIELVDSTVRSIIKEEVNIQLPQILPQAISDVATPVIEKNVIKSLKSDVLTRSSSQPQSSYEAVATLSEFELTKILIDKIDKNKSFDVADYKRELYDALVKSYNTDRDIFKSYGEVFSLKRSRYERDKYRDLSAGSNRGTKRRKSSKDADKSCYAKEPSHTVEDSGMQQDQEFITEDNEEQPADKEVTKADWLKKPERPLTLNPDWSKRQHVDFQHSQTWISQVALVEEPPTSFHELNDTSFDFSIFVMNRLKILNLTQAILVGPAFNLLKGTCKSITELEYHLEECSKATTERLNWHNPENK